MPEASRADLADRWRRCINTSPSALLEWLETPASASVGTRTTDERWSVGQLSGFRTVELLETPPEQWRDSEWAHVRRVSSFVRRHRAQWPRGDVADRRWRHALRNWGHDPLWEGRLSVPRPEAEHQSLRVDGEEVGSLVLHDSGPLVEICRIELSPQWRGRGVGSAVLHSLALASGARLTVELSPDDPVGEFFVRRGFHSPDNGSVLIRA